MQDGKEDEAIAIARRAAADVKDRDMERLTAQLYVKPGENLAKAGHWDDALALAQRGLAKIDGTACFWVGTGTDRTACQYERRRNGRRGCNQYLAVPAAAGFWGVGTVIDAR